MPEQVLSRSQRNDVFEVIRNMDLDPVDFEWSTGGGSVAYDPFKEILAHHPTGGHFDVSNYEGGFWFHWWPSRQRGQRSEHGSWQQAMNGLMDWLAAVHDDHTVPDLWGAIAKEKVISGASARPEYEKPFSLAELKQLETSLADIEHYIETTQSLEPAQRKTLHQRFVYLSDAAKKGARKIDWLNIFVAQMITLVTAGIVDPRVYGPVMAHAAAAMNAIFQFGLKLLN